MPKVTGTKDLETRLSVLEKEFDKLEGTLGSAVKRIAALEKKGKPKK